MHDHYICIVPKNDSMRTLDDILDKASSECNVEGATCDWSCCGFVDGVNYQKYNDDGSDLVAALTSITFVTAFRTMAWPQMCTFVTPDGTHLDTVADKEAIDAILDTASASDYVVMLDVRYV